MKKKILTLLGAGHAFTDANQSALPMVLVFLQPVLALTQLQVGIVMMAFNLCSSIIQPAFGILSDRFNASFLIPAGCLVAGLGMAFSGYASSYPLIIIAALVSGLGIAAYHPEGSKFARFASGARKASGMSIYSVGGNFGFAAGPVLATLFYKLAGFKGTTGFLVLSGIMALLLWFYLPQIRAAQATPKEIANDRSREHGAAGGKNFSLIKIALPVVLLVTIIIMRTWIHYGLVTFLPQYYVNYLSHSATYAASMTTLFLFSGAIGTIAGGPAADRWGLKTIIILSMSMMVPLLYFLPLLDGAPALPVVALTGFALISTFAVTVVLGQELLPNNVGLASGLTLGFGIGMGGVGATLLGWAADNWGFPVIFRIMIVFALAGMLLALFLPGKQELLQRKKAMAN